MKKIIYTIILTLFMVNGFVIANNKDKTDKKPNQNQISVIERNAELKKWEASPDGIMFKKWEASPAGIKVHVGAAKINKYIRNYSNIEGIVSSLNLPLGSRLGFGMMVKINNEDYILAFGLEQSNEFNQLRSLKVNNKIVIKSHSVSKAPKYAFPIITGEYVEQDGKIIYKRIPRKGGC
jgi:hypothetical protein